ncbi:amidotransferase [Thioalkalivibrio denitrificans]|uniref:Amidotransferase n=2 Tax=Thioalkalivibrio denitrificans TaxID=108003 RepID=A0A1V3NE92_9GAMM|nr:amidotransferase [Thioalkalivibrio denitrificans]
MRAHFLQHVPFEGLGSIEPWLKGAGFEISCTRFFESTGLPDPAAFDLLIVMGGPMSVNDEDRFPWLRDEKQFIRNVIDRGTSVLGICLGAQLIAGSLGASVDPNPHKEIGWFPVHGVPSGDSRVFHFPSSVEAFHWHGETFDLPPGAVRIAQSEGCVNQGFQIGASVIGLQFHLETTPESARAIVSHCRDELQPGRYVQPEAEILGAPQERYDAINRLMDEILSFLCDRSG